MNDIQKKFLNVLFDAEQKTCFTPLPTGTKVKTEPSPYDVFFSINALHPTKDLNPEREYHNENSPRRADHNVICYRNFLIELDGLPLEQQIDYVKSKVPVTSIVYSGGKSYHFIISLEEPVDSEQYRKIAAQLHTLIPLADKSCKNPSRLSRLPDVLRKETGNMQTLVELGTRVHLQTLTSVLPLIPDRKFQTNFIMDKTYITTVVKEAVENPVQAMSNMEMESRNRFMYWLGKRLENLDLPQESKLRLVEMAYNNLPDTKGFAFEEALLAARLK